MGRSGGGRSGGGGSRSSSSFSSGRSSSSRGFSHSSSTGRSKSTSPSIGRSMPTSRPSSRPSSRVNNTILIGNTVNRRPTQGGGGYSGGGFGGDFGGSSTYREPTAYETQAKTRRAILGVLSAIIVLMFILVTIYAVGSSGSTAGIPRNSIQRQALPEGAAQGEVIQYEDATGDDDWFNDYLTLEMAATEAYKLTGVKFGVYATRNIDGEINPTHDEIAAYADALYQEWFDDESHALILVLDQPHRDGYYVYFKIGASAGTVFDHQAVATMDAYLERYWFSDLTESQLFSKTILDTSKHIMQITPTLSSIVLPWFLRGIILIMVLSAVFKIIDATARHKHAKAEQAIADAELLRAPITGLDQDAVESNPLVARYLQDQDVANNVPSYRAPSNPLEDPYAPKPAGYAAEQSRLGHPNAPPQAHLGNPHDLPNDEHDKQADYEEYKEFIESFGIDYTDVEMREKYEAYKREQSRRK